VSLVPACARAAVSSAALLISPTLPATAGQGIKTASNRINKTRFMGFTPPLEGA